MGKTPAKWIKSLLGKKSSRSTLSKKGEVLKSVKKGEDLISSKAPVPDVTLDPTNLSPGNTRDSEDQRVPQLSNSEVTQPTSEGESTFLEKLNLSSLDSTERIKVETAAATVQAAFRGYLARRAFRTLKGIIRLQALIRGHLVRRQAVATLHCVWGIVRVQALARGQIIRHSELGIEVQKVRGQGKCLVSNCTNSSRLSASSKLQSENAFVRKLLASLPSAMPLRLEYGPGEPNSMWEWLSRWTMSDFWKPLSQLKGLEQESLKEHDSFQKVGLEETRAKRRLRKPSNANVETGSNGSILVSNRPKRTQRRSLGQRVYSKEAQPQRESEKVGHRLRKFSNQSGVDSGKLKHNLKKSSGLVAPSVSELHNSDTFDKTKETVAEQIDLEKDMKLPVSDVLVDRSHENSTVVGLQLPETNGKVECIQGVEECSSKDGDICNESQKTGHRRTSLPANVDHQENGMHNKTRVPSYMAPTESARAKLRGQGSPRFAPDVADDNGTARRHSLPSSTSGKVNSPSLRAERLVQSNGKGAVKIDKSLTSSRDCGKFIQAEWKR